MHGLIIIIVFAILIILVYSSPTDNGKVTESPKSLLETVEELKLANEQLADKVGDLEKRIGELSISQQYMREDIKYFHPTAEYLVVDMTVYNWTEVFKTELAQQNIPLQMGHAIGIPSFWIFYLNYDREMESIGVGLLLRDIYNYNRDVLFAGFSVNVLDTNGNVFTNMSLTPTNFLELENRFAQLGNVIPLSTIQNPENKLLSNNTVRFKFTLELLGNGHKLYRQSVSAPGRDVQLVMFQVQDFLVKMNTVEEDTSSIAHTTFQITHPWGMITNWNAEIKVERDRTIALLMELTDMDFEWKELYASFKIEISDSQKRVVTRHQAPYHDYKKQLLLFENIIAVERIQSLAEDTLEFKMYFVVYNQNARFYNDIF